MPSLFKEREMVKAPTRHHEVKTKEDEPVAESASAPPPPEIWVHVPPSQQSAQGPAPKPGEPVRADNLEVTSPRVRKI